MSENEYVQDYVNVRGSQLGRKGRWGDWLGHVDGHVQVRWPA